MPKKVENVGVAVRKITDGGKGANYTFDAVGLEVTADQAVNFVRPGGTSVIVGVAPPKAHVAVNLLKTVAQEKRIVGSFMGSSVPSIIVPKLCGLYKKGDLMLDELVSKYYNISDAQSAFDELASGANLRGVFVMHELAGKAKSKASSL